MKKLILPLMMLLPATAMWGFDAYFYKEGTNRAEHVARNVTSIEFQPQTTILTRSDFTTSEIDNASFHHMLFRDKSTSGIRGIATSSDRINITTEGERLHVTSETPICTLQIFSASGFRIAALSTPASALTYDTSALMSGVYLVRAQSGDHATVYKFIKK